MHTAPAAVPTAPPAVPTAPKVPCYDDVETQPYQLDTQMVVMALTGLDGVASASVTHEQRSPLGSSSDKGSRGTTIVTPSPRSLHLPEISPVKTAVMRNDQLNLKGQKQKELADKKEKAAAKKEAELPRGGRGRGGRGRGRGSGKSQPEMSEKDEGEEKPEDVEMAPSGEKPSQNITETENANAEVKKNKGGRPRKLKDDDTKQTTDKDESTKKRSKTEGAEPEATKKKPKATEPATTCVGKRKDGGKDGALHIKRAKDTPAEFPNTFARRYRPCKDSWAQRLWDGAFLAFQSTITPSMQAGQKTKLEARD